MYQHCSRMSPQQDMPKHNTSDMTYRDFLQYDAHQLIDHIDAEQLISKPVIQLWLGNCDILPAVTEEALLSK